MPTERRRWDSLLELKACLETKHALGTTLHFFVDGLPLILSTLPNMYPRTYFATNRPVQKPGTCFVVMPFDPEFEPVFKTIRDALEADLGFTCARTKELFGGGHIIEDVLRGLGESEFVVVDVTGRNPNVFYELGIAHMCKKVENVILLAQEIGSIPFDLLHFRHIVYSPSSQGFQSLRETLRNAVTAVGDVAARRITVNVNGTGALPKMLMGTDHCLYQFEVLSAFFGHDGAKFLLQVTRHAMGQERETEVLFQEGMGMNVGERRTIPNTEWSVCLERVAEDRTVLRIDTAAPSP